MISKERALRKKAGFIFKFVIGPALLLLGLVAARIYTYGNNVVDVNGDAATNVVDVQLAVNQALGVTACAADINNDGVCNVIDVQRGVNAALGGQCVSP